jgi:deoxyadenosine/deoxycytidine kinase
MVKIFSIEGNIGSGKSTLIKRLQQSFTNFVYLPEPVDLWNEIKDTSGVTILEKYYSNKERYSFSFQMMAYITRLSQIKECIKNSPSDAVIITERCLLTDRYVFAKMLYDNNFIEEIEYSIYKRWFDEFDEYPLTGIIYIKTTPEICLARVNHRNRKGEETIPIEYLSCCHDYHEQWINKSETVKMIVDGNLPIRENEIISFLSQR